MEGTTGRTITSDRRRMDFCHLSRTDLTEKKLEYGRVCSKYFVSGQLSKDLGNFNVDWRPTLYLGLTREWWRGQTPHEPSEPNEQLGGGNYVNMCSQKLPRK